MKSKIIFLCIILTLITTGCTVKHLRPYTEIKYEKPTEIVDKDGQVLYERFSWINFKEFNGILDFGENSKVKKIAVYTEASDVIKEATIGRQAEIKAAFNGGAQLFDAGGNFVGTVASGYFQPWLGFKSQESEQQASYDLQKLMMDFTSLKNENAELKAAAEENK